MRWTREEAIRKSKCLLLAAGAHDSVAEDCAEAMVRGSIRGVDTHGLKMLPKILSRAEEGRCQLSEPVETFEIFGAVARADAKHAPGQHACMAATRTAIDLAKESGVGYVTVRDSTHFGCCTPFLEALGEAGMIGLVASNSLQSMAAFGLRRANLGNNPFGFVSPTETHPFLFDFSAAKMSYGRRAEYLASNRELPPGTFIEPEQDADDFGVCEIADSLDHLALPFGEFKGASVAVMIEVLTGVLSGGFFGAETEIIKDETFLGPSHFVIAWNPAAIAVDNFNSRMQRLVEDVRRGEDGLRLPGDRAHETAQERLVDGIPMDPSLIEKIIAWRDRLECDLEI